MSSTEWQELVKDGASNAKLRRYKYIGRAGNGSSSVVFKVWRKDISQFRVLKLNFDKVQAETERMLLQSVHHPGIVRLCDSFTVSFQYKPALILELEYCEDGTVEELVHQTRIGPKACPESRIWHILQQICTALSVLHEKGIIHRDLTPSNLLLTKTHVKIADLGVASILKGRTHTVHAAGQVQYMAPEVRRFLVGAKVGFDSKADIYSLGKIILALTLGTVLPRPGVKYKNDENVADEIPIQYSMELKVLVHQMLETDPKKRPTAKEILARTAKL